MKDVQISNMNQSVISSAVGINLSETQRERAIQLAEKLDPTDVNAVLSFGYECQSKISQTADQVLAKSRMRDLGEVAEKLMLEAITTIEELDPNSISTKLSKIPVLGSIFMNIKKSGMHYQKVQPQIEKIGYELRSSQAQLVRDSALLQELMKQLQQYHDELNVYTIAGTLALNKFNGSLAEMASQANEQELFRLQRAADRLERRIHNFKLSSGVVFEMIPELGILEYTNQMLIENAHDIIMLTMPLCKVQIGVVLNQEHQKRALETNRKVKKLNSELQKQIARSLRDGVQAIGIEIEQGIADIETFRETRQDILESLRSLVQIQKDGREKRKLVEAELVRLDQELKTGIREILMPQETVGYLQ